MSNGLQEKVWFDIIFHLVRRLAVKIFAGWLKKPSPSALTQRGKNSFYINKSAIAICVTTFRTMHVETTGEGRTKRNCRFLPVHFTLIWQNTCGCCIPLLHRAFSHTSLITVTYTQRTDLVDQMLHKSKSSSRKFFCTTLHQPMECLKDIQTIWLGWQAYRS